MLKKHLAAQQNGEFKETEKKIMTDILKTKSNLRTSLILIQGFQNRFKADLKFIEGKPEDK